MRLDPKAAARPGGLPAAWAGLPCGLRASFPLPPPRSSGLFSFEFCASTRAAARFARFSRRRSDPTDFWPAVSFFPSLSFLFLRSLIFPLSSFLFPLSSFLLSLSLSLPFPFPCLCRLLFIVRERLFLLCSTLAPGVARLGRPQGFAPAVVAWKGGARRLSIGRLAPFARACPSSGLRFAAGFCLAFLRPPFLLPKR